MEWKTIERPGYFGKRRDELSKRWDKEYGKDNWRISYMWGNLVIPRLEGIQIYEDAYYEFFKSNPNTLDWLITTASDVYDTAPTNVKAGFSYEQQETVSNHIHDVSIRRAVLRTGNWFDGDHVMHVRWTDSEGYRINPGVVPFHLPNLIYNGEIKSYSGKEPWWFENTIEDFYQKNKILEIK